jgi:deoxyribodipyrimidine photo-lyase
MKHAKNAVCWIRRDLRLYDHVALSAATANCDHVHLVFVFDPSNLSEFQNKHSHHVQFMFESLQTLDAELKTHGHRMAVLYGDPVDVLQKFCQEHKIDQLHFNKDYEPSAIDRDARVTRALRDQGVEVFSYKDSVIFEEHDVVKADQQPYKVFTPYKNAWLQKLSEKPLRFAKVNLEKVTASKTASTIDDFSLRKFGYQSVDLGVFQPGTEGGKKQFASFVLEDYKENRDYPALLHGTSRLSPHLRFGTVSCRHLLKKSLERKTLGHQTWLSELIWREFYQMILFHFPHVETSAFRTEYQEILWPGLKEHLEAWKAGQTGYPIVDAAQRQLLKTGWMHNRLRMITASFLVKDLLVDWREGVEWFKQHLVDHDLAANNGGWQWAASTGCDAQPYFRIFNPTLQSEKFDPSGDFIRAFVPELKGFSSADIHTPWLADKETQRQAGCEIGIDYPSPIVDHATQKPKVLKLFKA